MRPRLHVVAVLVMLLGCSGAESQSPPGLPAHHGAGEFRNPDPEVAQPHGWPLWRFLAVRAWGRTVSPRSFAAPRATYDPREFAAGTGEPAVTWVGHSTLLIRLDRVNILTDPHWGDRASPLPFGGPRRFSSPGIAFDDLPHIDVVLISHDHYDHLDLATVRRLAHVHAPLFLAPSGFKAWFADSGITRAEDLDWWDTREYRGVRFTALPAQHFCQRTPWDRNRRLWASWAVLGPGRRLYFGGDTGYFRGFAEVGARLGPFDLAAISIGAYSPANVMRPNHTSPEEAVRAAEDLRSGAVLGIHWGTFDLADEPPDEPPRRLLAAAARRGLDRDSAWVLKLGETRAW